MDPRFSAQDVLRCDLCENPVPPMYCDFCHVKLCKACVLEHISDLSKEHKVVTFKQRRSTPSLQNCLIHVNKPCELRCENCDIPVCSLCISEKHKGHEFLNIAQNVSAKKEEIKNDLKELENYLHPKYEEIESNIRDGKSTLKIDYGKLTTAVAKQGEDWHREINIIVNKRKSEIDEMKTEHLAVLNKQENEIKQNVYDIEQSILDLKKILDSNDVSLISAYKSKNVEFRRLPPKIKVALPSFSSRKINVNHLSQTFGSLSQLSITADDHGYAMETRKFESFSPVKPLLDEPELISTIETNGLLCDLSLLSDKKIWTNERGGILRLFNLQSKLLKSIQTKSGNKPNDIAVTKNGDLVYTDGDEHTVNILKNERIQEVIRLQRWKPYGICSTSSGDLLVTLCNVGEESKVVSYSDFDEKQTIQFDNDDKPLYSFSNHTKNICENRNLDICVADQGAKAVVVVNQAGKLRFRYTGHPFTTKESFNPVDITTDSQSQILTAESNKHRIHILDQDGHFLRYIDNCSIDFPKGLCVDTNDNLFVAEWITGKIKQIKYM